MAQVTCQACGKITKEGAFCSKCGTELPAAASSPVSAEESLYEMPAAGPADAVDGQVTLVGIARPALEQPLQTGVTGSGVQPTPRTATAAIPPQASAHATTVYSVSFDDCPWVWVERDTMAFCVSGANGLLRLRVSAHMEGIEDLRVSLSLRGMHGEARQSCWSKPKPEQVREIKLDVPPLPPGAHTADIRLQFTKNQQVLKYEANTELYVYPVESSAKQIAESIVVNITNDIKTGHASDVHLSQDAAEAISKFTHNGNAYSLTELLNLMKSDQRAYRREEFYEAGCENLPSAPTQPPEEALVKRLTLCVGGRLVHLLADRRVTLGKNRANGIVTRLFGPGGETSDKRCERISRFHCTLELDGRDCVIHDGALDEKGRMKASSWGVFWQGKSVAGSLRVSAESFPLRAALGLAGTADAYDFGLTAHGYHFDQRKCVACEDSAVRPCLKGNIPAVLLRRTDDVPECYVLLWSCFDLGHVFPVCEGLTVCHEQGAFSWRSAGAFGWMTPGRYASAGTEIAVRAFAQVGL
jgi:hypothetical protein